MTAAHIERTHPEIPVKDSLFRAGQASVDASAVGIDRTGGKYGAGLIENVSLIALGEAKGHAMWIDAETLSQVAASASLGKHGIKSRFTHPSMSADGMGRHLGRITGVRVDGDRVVGDLHFAASSHSTPDGDLANYVMDLTDEDPQAAGLSIVFEHDFEAERTFAIDHGADDYGDGIDFSTFQSPDPKNTNNYPHVRLATLRAADVVDEPAANPDGMFDRQSLARDVDDLLSFAAGISKDKPSANAFGVDADGHRSF